MRTNLPLQEAVDVPKTTQVQVYVAGIIVAALVLAVIYQWYRSEYNGLELWHERHLTHVRGQKLRQTPASLRVPATADINDYAARLRALFDRAERGETTPDENKSVTRAFLNTAIETRSVWKPFSAYAPRTAVRAIQVAVFVATFGAVAVSTSWIVNWLQGDGTSFSLQAVATALVDGTTAFVELVNASLHGFPYLQSLFSLALTFAIIVADTAYSHWGWSAGTLTVLALALIALDKYASRRDDTALLERRRTGLAVAKWTLAVWAAGAIPASIGATIGTQTAAGYTIPVAAAFSLLGLFLAFVVAVYALYRGAKSLVKSIRRVAGLTYPYRDHDRDDLLAVLDSHTDESVAYDANTAADVLADKLDDTDHTWRRRRADPALAAYLIVRRITLGAISAFSILAGWYVIIAVAEGKLARVAVAAYTAPVERQAVLALVLLVPVAAVVYATRGTWGELRSALAESWARRRVRFAVLNRGVPYITVVFAYAAAYGFVQSIPVALVLSIGAGFVAYAASIVLQRAKYRASIYEDVQPPQSALVQAWVVEDADGDEHYLASVNGRADQAWTSPDRVVDALVDGDDADEGVVDAVREHETVPATMPGWHAEMLLSRGFVDTDDNDTRVGEKTRKETMQRLRDASGGVLHMDELTEDVDDLGEHRVEDKLYEMWANGIVRIAGDYVHLERDPWAK